MDVKQIKENRRTVREGYLDSPYNAEMCDSDADYASACMNVRPTNKDGLVPDLKPDRRYENEG